MSGHYNDYYGSSRSGRETPGPGRHDRDRERYQELPPLRDVLPDQFEGGGDRLQPYNVERMNHGMPAHRRDGGQTGPRLPPMQEHSLRGRQDEYGYNRPAAYAHHYGQGLVRPLSAQGSRSSAGSREPVYHVLVPSHEKDELIPVSESYSKPPGIVRENILSSGIYDNDPKKKFECNICGRRIERQSVYNQHMLTHTGERPFECSYCPKAFNSKSNLNRHLQSHGRQGNDEDGEPSSSKKYYSSSSRRT
ncbi:hypothetical protein BU17DRAFT_67939 [Hysterangium stoloniferum]|nr:hypothetical protein BU17DRAFT_67939 [Hysterangium stoloniferum]